MDKQKRYSDYNSYLRKLFGQRVQKISVDAGLSCPNRDGLLSTRGCVYCNAKGSGSGMFATGLSIREQIKTGKIGMIKKYKAKKFLAYFQSYTNTYTSCKHMKQMYDEALSCDGMVGMAIGTRPDCIDTEKLDLIESYTENYLVWLEYGLQSVHDVTLKMINRGHTVKDFFKMMLESAKILADSSVNGVKIHLLYVVKGTMLDKMWKNGEYTPMEQKEYVDTVCDFIELLPDNIIIQRITGDPHGDELRAPMWAGRYRETFNMIQHTFEKRDSFQGIKYKI